MGGGIGVAERLSLEQTMFLDGTIQVTEEAVDAIMEKAAASLGLEPRKMVDVARLGVIYFKTLLASLEHAGVRDPEVQLHAIKRLMNRIEDDLRMGPAGTGIGA